MTNTYLAIRHLAAGMCMAAAMLLSPDVRAQPELPPYSILQNNRDYVLQADGRFATTSEMLVRINANEALAANQQQDIQFDAKAEKIRLVDAWLEHSDGQRVHVGSGAARISAGTVSEGQAKFRDRRFLHIPYRGLRVGDRLYYKVRTAQPKPTSISSQFFGAWTGPDGGPGQYAITIERPAGMPLYTQARGFRAMEPRTTNGRIITRWVHDTERSGRMEVGSANRSAYRDLLVASTFRNYAELAQVYDQQERQQLKTDRFAPQLAALVGRVTAGLPDQRSKALAIHAWIQRHIHYRAIYFGDGAWLPSRPVHTILQSGWGDCKDHAVLMDAMLGVAGIDSSAALISWGDDFFTLPEVAMLHFNHVINYLPALDLYLDSTSKDVEGGYLPADQLDKATLLTRTGVIARTPAHQPGQIIKQFEVRVGDDGAARFSYRINNTGSEAEPKRAYTRAHANEAASGVWLNTMLDARGWTGSAREFYDNIQDHSGDFHMAYTDGVIEHFLPERTPHTMSASSALWEDIRNQVFTYVADATRTQPFRCAQQDIIERAVYTFADTLTVAAVPDDVSVADDFFDYSARYRRLANGVEIERHLRTRRTGHVLCTPGDYATAANTIEAMRKDVMAEIVLRSRQANSPPALQ
jgi:transglutaminase-like putative cysteine protease